MTGITKQREEWLRYEKQVSAILHQALSDARYSDTGAMINDISDKTAHLIQHEAQSAAKRAYEDIDTQRKEIMRQQQDVQSMALAKEPFINEGKMVCALAELVNQQGCELTAKYEYPNYNVTVTVSPK